MSLRSHARTTTASKAADTKGTGTAPAERPRAAASLDVWLSLDWSQGIHLGTLDEFQQVHVCTRNTLYELIVINHRGDVRVRGGKYFPEWTAARVAGCTAGGSFLKRLSITLGLQIEFEVDCRRIITSPVRTIAVLQRSLASEPN
jgi:hypothetical protein